MANSCASRNEFPSVLPCTCSKNKTNLNCRHFPSSYSSSRSSQENPYLQAEEEQTFDFEQIKTILRKCSSTSGDNLFDHLVEIIKRIIDERPINVVDYFEQLSRSVRATKLNSPGKPQFLEIAESFVEFIQIPNSQDHFSYIGELEDYAESEMTVYQSSDSMNEQIPRSLLESENVLQTQHYFAFCGLGFDVDEVFQLALSVQKVQQHAIVENARFWGRIFGLQGSYFVVEAELTRIEIENRLKTMKASLLDEMRSFMAEKNRIRSPNSSDAELFPGFNWQNFPEEDLKKMQYPTEPIPQLEFQKIFHSPEELVGSGLNRKTYFVTTSLSGEWQELPNVAPRHIKASRRVKKYFTGDLNKNLEPLFPGSEAHYLRAMIARISAGTSIAPKGFYRRMTRAERNQTDENYEADQEEVFAESDDEDDFDNDDPITRNKDYKQLSMEEAAHLTNWVHFRPNILNQGRILHVNEELTIQDLERKATSSMNGSNGLMCEDDGDYECEEEGIQDEEVLNVKSPETGPELFSTCNRDKNTEGIPSWTLRYSSVYNKVNQMVMMRSNLWPGAYSIAFENVSDCIYLGWGFKYVARCTSLRELPTIRDADYAGSAVEINDPTVEMEEKWKKYHMKRDLIVNDGEEMSAMSVEVDFEDND